MNYADWEASVPRAITEDSLWRMKVYRLALFATRIGRQDVTKLMQDRRTIGMSDQLCRALGSISANIAEGYSRGSNKDRIRFYEYSLGSAREARDWYYQAESILSSAVLAHRVELLAEVIRMLLAVVRAERGLNSGIFEEPADYDYDQ